MLEMRVLLERVWQRNRRACAHAATPVSGTGASPPVLGIVF